MLGKGRCEDMIGYMGRGGGKGRGRVPDRVPGATWTGAPATPPRLSTFFSAHVPTDRCWGREVGEGKEDVVSGTPHLHWFQLGYFSMSLFLVR